MFFQLVLLYLVDKFLFQLLFRNHNNYLNYSCFYSGKISIEFYLHDIIQKEINHIVYLIQF